MRTTRAPASGSEPHGLFLLVARPPIAGAFVGWKIYGLLDERRFQQMFAGLLVVSGVLPIP